MDSVVRADDPRLSKVFTREELIELLAPVRGSVVPRSCEPGLLPGNRLEALKGRLKGAHSIQRGEHEGRHS